MAVGTRRLTVRSVDSLTARTLMIVMLTTPARSKQRMPKPAINRPRIFKFRNGMVRPPQTNLAKGRFHHTLSVNHEFWDNDGRVQIRSCSAQERAERAYPGKVGFP